MITYRGINRNGQGLGGFVTTSPAEFVRTKFELGWRRLEVTRDGVEIGRIGRLENRRTRTWWAEGGDGEIGEGDQ